MLVVQFTVDLIAVNPPRLRLWCCLVTRTVSPKFAEGTSHGALEDIKKGLDAHRARGARDLESVRGLSYWTSDLWISEAVVGRVFLFLLSRPPE